MINNNAINYQQY